MNQTQQYHVWVSIFMLNVIASVEFVYSIISMFYNNYYANVKTFDSFFYIYTIICEHVYKSFSSTIDCPGPPDNITVISPVPPNVDLLWDQPSTADMWSFMYRIDWQNGTSAVGDTTDMRGTLSGLEAVTEYAVTITAFTDSTLCPEQSINFTFNTTQSEY